MRIVPISFNNICKLNKTNVFQTQPKSLKADSVEFSFGSAQKVSLQKEATDLKTQADAVLEKAQGIKDFADGTIDESIEIINKSYDVLDSATYLYMQVSDGFKQAEDKNVRAISDGWDNLEMTFHCDFPYDTTTMRGFRNGKLVLSASKGNNGCISVKEISGDDSTRYNFSKNGDLQSCIVNQGTNNSFDESYFFQDGKLSRYISDASAKSPYAIKYAQDYHFANNILTEYREDETISQKDIVHSVLALQWLNGELFTYKKENLGNEYWSVYEEAMTFGDSCELRKYSKECLLDSEKEQAQRVFLYEADKLKIAQVNFDAGEDTNVEKCFVYDFDTQKALGCYLDCIMASATKVGLYDKYVDLD